MRTISGYFYSDSGRCHSARCAARIVQGQAAEQAIFALVGWEQIQMIQNQFSEHIISRNFPSLELVTPGKTCDLIIFFLAKHIYMLAPSWAMQETVVEQLVLMRDFSNKQFWAQRGWPELR